MAAQLEKIINLFVGRTLSGNVLFSVARPYLLVKKLLVYLFLKYLLESSPI